jgi:hypothetical protein
MIFLGDFMRDLIIGLLISFSQAINPRSGTIPHIPNLSYVEWVVFKVPCIDLDLPMQIFHDSHAQRRIYHAGGEEWGLSEQYISPWLGRNLRQVYYSRVHVLRCFGSPVRSLYSKRGSSSWHRQFFYYYPVNRPMRSLWRSYRFRSIYVHLISRQCFWNTCM